MVSRHTANEVQESVITAREHPLCDCPEPCGCYVEGYAAGKDKAFCEIISSLEGPPHAQDCGCQPCQVKRACLQKVMAPFPQAPGVRTDRQSAGQLDARCIQGQVPGEALR